MAICTLIVLTVTFLILKGRGKSFHIIAVENLKQPQYRVVLSKDISRIRYLLFPGRSTQILEPQMVLRPYCLARHKHHHRRFGLSKEPRACLSCDVKNTKNLIILAVFT